MGDVSEAAFIAHISLTQTEVGAVNMGLDIYFYKRDKDNYKHLTELGYFRKVNFLVNYFNLENCVDHICTRDEMETLLSKCNSVLEKKTESISDKTLPTTSGFFFGSTDYDDWYYKDIQSVKDTITKALNDWDEYKEELIFHAWW